MSWEDHGVTFLDCQKGCLSERAARAHGRVIECNNFKYTPLTYLSVPDDTSEWDFQGDYIFQFDFWVDQTGNFRSQCTEIKPDNIIKRILGYVLHLLGIRKKWKHIQMICD